MDFITRKQTSSRIANPVFIAVYRELLLKNRSAAATMRMANEFKLAEALVYEALAYYTPEQIIAATKPVGSVAAPSIEQRAETVVTAVKKNFQNSQSIRKSTGVTSTTTSSGQPTAFSRIASTAGAILKSWKASSVIR